MNEEKNQQEAVKQAKKQLPEAMRKFIWKPGQSGNPKGRPLGKTMKDYAREYLACLTEEERTDFLNDLDPNLIWRMAEGNPHQTHDVKGEVKVSLNEIKIKKFNDKRDTR